MSCLVYILRSFIEFIFDKKTRFSISIAKDNNKDMA
jgi:hypothetical protein